MTREEAINAIKCNYPPEHYSMLREALDMAIKELEERKTTKWNKTSEVEPTEEKQYLCCKMFTTRPFFKILHWSNDLYEVDDCDFYDCKGKSGFYGYSSEYGHYEDDCDYWKEIDWGDDK